MYKDSKSCVQYGYGGIKTAEFKVGIIGLGGHGGIDWLVFDAYFTSLRDNVVPPIDTYDTAAWMAISPLSEISIANGCTAVDIPDFTRGMWTCRTDKNTGFYSLDR